MAREDLLGDGLSNLASQGSVRPVMRQQLVPAPWQPRRHFDREALLALARSIRREGIRQNLVVRPHPTERGRYEVIAGERRWRASDPQLHEQLNLTQDERATLVGEVPTQLPCLIVNLSDADARRLSAVENLQRENLDPVDEASYRLLLLQDAMNFKSSQTSVSKLAQEIGRRLHSYRNHREQYTAEIQAVEELFQQLGTLTWESYTTNHLPLLQPPEDLLEAVREGKMAGRSALLINRQTDKAMQRKLLQLALAGASFKELTATLETQQGESWKSLAHKIRSQLSVRQLERVEPGRRRKIIKLLEELQKELGNGAERQEET